MSEIAFELWSDIPELDELLPFLRAEGLTIGDPVSLHTRSLEPAQVTTIIVAISGATIAVARAFRAYFERTGKRFTASTEDRKIHAENFTADEIRKLVGTSKLLLLDKKPKDKNDSRSTE